MIFSKTQPSLVLDPTLLTRLLAVFFLLAGTVVGSCDEEWPKQTPEGYRIPQPNPELGFPAAHGSHPGFRIEWWYLTGHLFARGENDEAKQRRFGIQATFFRLAQQSGMKDVEDSAFGSGQLYLAHMALTDVNGKRFYHEERLNREGWDASAKMGDLDVRNGNWSLRRVEGLETIDSTDGSIRLRGSILSDVSFDLLLEPGKSAVLFGENGVSRKGADPAASSLYLTFPRLKGSGQLEIDGETLTVAGELWMDHEISSSQLGRDQVGWDWMSIQFIDGREMMAYILRKPDGTPDPFSALAWIDAKGRVTHQKLGEYEWRSGGSWKSQKTGDVYPISPQVTSVDPATGERRKFEMRPVFNDQELTGGLGGVSYWEGACDVVELPSGEIVGRAYLELTGYAIGGDLGRRLRGE